MAPSTHEERADCSSKINVRRIEKSPGNKHYFYFNSFLINNYTKAKEKPTIGYTKSLSPPPPPHISHCVSYLAVAKPFKSNTRLQTNKEHTYTNESNDNSINTEMLVDYYGNKYSNQNLVIGDTHTPRNMTAAAAVNKSRSTTNTNTKQTQTSSKHNTHQSSLNKNKPIIYNSMLPTCILSLTLSSLLQLLPALLLASSSLLPAANSSIAVVQASSALKHGQTGIFQSEPHNHVDGLAPQLDLLWIGPVQHQQQRTNNNNNNNILRQTNNNKSSEDSTNKQRNTQQANPKINHTKQVNNDDGGGGGDEQPIDDIDIILSRSHQRVQTTPTILSSPAVPAVESGLALQKASLHQEGDTSNNASRRVESIWLPAGEALAVSSSQQQVYSECALILQRTYIKKSEDYVTQMMNPVGKTEQACISYRHIDAAIEQAKHKLKFNDFLQTQAALGSASVFDVLQTSVEPPSELIAALGELNMAVTQIIAQKFDLSNDELLNGLPLIDMSKTKFWPLCPLLVRQELVCKKSRYRTFTGHCNNLRHPSWGAAMTPFARYLPPVHPDGIQAPRKSVLPKNAHHRHGHYGGGAGNKKLFVEDFTSLPRPASFNLVPSHNADSNDIEVHMPHDEVDDTIGNDEATSSSSTNIRQQIAKVPHSTATIGDNNNKQSAAVAALSYQSSSSNNKRFVVDSRDADATGGESVLFPRHISFNERQQEHSFLNDNQQHNIPHDNNHHKIEPLASSIDEASLPHAVLFPGASSSSQALQALQLQTQAAAAGVEHNPAAAAAMQVSSSIPMHRMQGAELPSPRVLSTVVHKDLDLSNHDYSILFMSWGQLLDHDMTRAAQPPSTIKCCTTQGVKNKLCLPISVPRDDPLYSKFNVRCLEFRRTIAGLRPNCVLGPRVHQNAITSPIDANFVYGSSKAEADSLRMFNGGRLRDRDWFKQEGLKPLLPAQDVDPEQDCLGRPRDLFCFRAGDVRVNEQIHLTVLHTLYMRQHNRIADKLSDLNPHWNDERIYQETRHIVAATVQHVMLNEYIPLLIGPKMAELYNLTAFSALSSTGSTAKLLHDNDDDEHHYSHTNSEQPQRNFWHGYDPSVTTSVSNSFAAAAFRQGHTFIQGTVERYNKFHEFVGEEKLRRLLKQPFIIYTPGVLDELVGGLLNQPSQSFDPFLSQDITGHLFQPPEAKFGHDLASINLQRGREQGLPGYNIFREWCGLPRAETFEQLEPFLTNRTAYQYSQLYRHVDDIDLWSAGISERRLPGAAVGPTFACLIARQFSNTRRGDRFWYENPGLPSSFTPSQLAEIRKVTLAKILCANSDDMPTIQRWALRMPHPVLNERVPCKLLPDIDLKHWITDQE